MTNTSAFGWTDFDTSINTCSCEKHIETWSDLYKHFYRKKRF